MIQKLSLWGPALTLLISSTLYADTSITPSGAHLRQVGTSGVPYEVVSTKKAQPVCEIQSHDLLSGQSWIVHFEYDQAYCETQSFTLGSVSQRATFKRIDLVQKSALDDRDARCVQNAQENLIQTLADNNWRPYGLGQSYYHPNCEPALDQTHGTSPCEQARSYQNGLREHRQTQRKLQANLNRRLELQRLVSKVEIEYVDDRDSNIENFALRPQVLSWDGNGVVRIRAYSRRNGCAAPTVESTFSQLDQQQQRESDELYGAIDETFALSSNGDRSQALGLNNRLQAGKHSLDEPNSTQRRAPAHRAI